MLLSLDYLPVSYDLSVCLYFGFLVGRVNFYRTAKQIVIKIKLLKNMNLLGSRNEIESALFFPSGRQSLSFLKLLVVNFNTVLCDKAF